MNYIDHMQLDVQFCKHQNLKIYFIQKLLKRQS